MNKAGRRWYWHARRYSGVSGITDLKGTEAFGCSRSTLYTPLQDLSTNVLPKVTPTTPVYPREAQLQYRRARTAGLPRRLPMKCSYHNVRVMKRFEAFAWHSVAIVPISRTSLYKDLYQPLPAVLRHALTQSPWGISSISSNCQSATPEAFVLRKCYFAS